MLYELRLQFYDRPPAGRLPSHTLCISFYLSKTYSRDKSSSRELFLLYLKFYGRKIIFFGFNKHRKHINSGLSNLNRYSVLLYRAITCIMRVQEEMGHDIGFPILTYYYIGRR